MRASGSDGGSDEDENFDLPARLWLTTSRLHSHCPTAIGRARNMTNNPACFAIQDFKMEAAMEYKLLAANKYTARFDSFKQTKQSGHKFQCYVFAQWLADWLACRQ